MTRTKAQHDLMTVLFNQSVILVQLQRPSEAIERCETIFARFSDLDDAQSQEDVGLALLQKSIIQANEGQHQEAIGILDQLIERINTREEPKLRGLMGQAFYSKGIDLADGLNDLGAALDCFEKAVEQFEPFTDADFLQRRGNALIRQAHTLNLLGKVDLAITLYNTIRVDFEARLPECPEQVATIWLNQALLFSQQKRHDEALELARQIIEKFHFHPPTEVKESIGKNQDIRRLVANAWLNSTADLADLNRESEKITSCEELIREFEKEEHPRIKALVARAYFNMARGYEEEHLQEEAIQVYEEIEQKFGKDSPLWIQQVAAQSSVNLALRLEWKGEIKRAIEVGTQVWNSYRHSPDPDLKQQAYMGLVNKTRALTNQPNEQKELQGYAELLEHAEEVVSRGMGDAVGMSLLNRAMQRWHNGQVEDALKDYDDLIGLLSSSFDENSEDKVFQALEYKSRASQGLKRFGIEKSCFETALRLFEQRDSHIAQHAMVWAYCSLGQFLLDVESDPKSALTVWKSGLELPYIKEFPCFGCHLEQMQEGVKKLESATSPSDL